MSKANIKKVAAEAGVSTATVSRVLNHSGYASDQIKKRVLTAVKALNYRPSAIARSLKQDKTYTIGVIIPDISNPYFMLLAKGIEDVVNAMGYHLIFSSSDGDHKKEAHLLSIMHEKRTDVIVLAASGAPIELIQQIRDTGTPIILADRRIEGVDSNSDFTLDTFVEDNIQTAKEITEILIKQGHTTIGFIHGGYKISTSRERIEGIHAACSEHGIPIKLMYDGQFNEEGGIDAAQYFMSLTQPPTAIFALNNKMAMGALQSLRQLGIRIPDQVKLASYGEIEAAKLLHGLKVLYVQQDPYYMGKEIGRRILEIQTTEHSLSSGMLLQIRPHSIYEQ